MVCGTSVCIHGQVTQLVVGPMPRSRLTKARARSIEGKRKRKAGAARRRARVDYTSRPAGRRPRNPLHILERVPDVPDLFRCAASCRRWLRLVAGSARRRQPAPFVAGLFHQMEGSSAALGPWRRGTASSSCSSPVCHSPIRFSRSTTLSPAAARGAFLPLRCTSAAASS